MSPGHWIWREFCPTPKATDWIEEPYKSEQVLNVSDSSKKTGIVTWNSPLHFRHGDISTEVWFGTVWNLAVGIPLGKSFNDRLIRHSFVFKQKEVAWCSQSVAIFNGTSKQTDDATVENLDEEWIRKTEQPVRNGKKELFRVAFLIVLRSLQTPGTSGKNVWWTRCNRTNAIIRKMLSGRRLFWRCGCFVIRAILHLREHLITQSDTSTQTRGYRPATKIPTVIHAIHTTHCRGSWLRITMVGNWAEEVRRGEPQSRTLCLQNITCSRKIGDNRRHYIKSSKSMVHNAYQR